MKRNLAGLVLLAGVLLPGCKNKGMQLDTRTVTVGENKCIVQLMPAGFQEGSENDNGTFDYYRVIIQSKAKMTDSSHIQAINFGMEQAIHKVIEGDTLLPAFVQRIANGKKESYEYIVSFERTADQKKYEILINDPVFEMGPLSLKF